MQTVWYILKKDIKSIWTNSAALIIILGLLILPSLYAWFNIKANWDPYSATGGIKVAVVNLDKGTVLFNNPINIGDEVIASLKTNTQLGWQFATQKEADYGVKSGKYYASITIPENFSAHLATLTEPIKIRPELIYVINEKENAIVPKITASGASSLKLAITENIISSINNVVLDVFHDVGKDLEQNSTKIEKAIGALTYLDEHRDTLENDIKKYQALAINASTTLDEIKNHLPDLENALDTVNSIASNGKTVITASESIMSEVGDIIENGLKFTLQFSQDAIAFLDKISSHINDTESAHNLLTMLKTNLENTSLIFKSLSNKLELIGHIIKTPLINNLIEDLNSLDSAINEIINDINLALTDLEEGKSLTLDTINAIKQKLQILIDRNTSILNTFVQTLKPSLTLLLNDSLGLTDQIDELTVRIKGKMPEISTSLNTAKDGVTKSIQLFSLVNESFPSLSEDIHTLVQKFNFLSEDGTLDKLILLLENNPSLVADFIATPVSLKQESIYAIPNYGSAMAPFYTTLAIWVGVVILTAVLSTEFHQRDELTEITLFTEYVGKGCFFIILSLLQSLIILLGDKYILGVYFDNFMAFLLIGLLISITFTFVIYSLVAVFGNIGKGIVIILLVLQISSSGGTFPIEVIPPFFQKISIVLPFTYAIGALREAQGGIVSSSLSRYLIYLVGFIITFFLLGAFLKPLLHELSEKLNKAFKKSGLGE